MATDSSSSAPLTSGNNQLLAAASTDFASQNFNFPNLAIRLDRSNYSLWRSTVRSALEAYGLVSFLTDTNPPSPTVRIPAVPATDPTHPNTAIAAHEVENPAFTSWVRKDRLILLWIRSTLTTPLLAIVARATTSTKAWDILARTFHAQTGTRQMHLRQQLQTLTKGSSSVLDYFEKKRALVDALSDCMCVISDADFVAYLLYGLGSQYSAFRSALSLRVEPLSSDELLGLLLQEEQRLEEATLSLSCPSANAVFCKSSNGRNSRSSTSRLDRSSDNHSSTDDVSTDKPKFQCQICKRPGHEALNCFQRLNLREFPATNRNAAARMNMSGKYAFMTSSNSPSDIVDPWFIDSGATNHVTADLGNLTLQSNYNGNDRLMVGNGTSPSTRNS